MSGFSADWLKLRERADLRARNAQIATAVEARFAQRDQLRVLDLGCGSGANIRASAMLLPAKQHWTLVDNDDAMLSAARDQLVEWADDRTANGDTLKFKKDGREFSVDFRCIDLATGLAEVPASRADLVTASALFDLTSAAFIRDVARHAAEARAAVYAALTYNGRQAWSPRQPSDNAIIAAFNKHQTGDKGFGSAAGPTAGHLLADALKAQGYLVQEADSPWRLDEADRALIDELAAGTIRAVEATGDVDQATCARWANKRKSGAEIGHTDVFGVPS